MNWRATIAAGLIFIALLAFVWVESSHRVAEEGEVFRHSFLGLNLYGIDADQVTRIRIERAGQDDLVLEKRGEDWYLAEPVQGLADSEEVKRMIETIATLRPNASREGVDLRDERFGLVEADLVATLTYDGDHTAQLKLGGEAPSGIERFATVSGSDKLFVVSASVRTSLWKNPGELREKSVAAIETDAVQKITLDHGDEHIEAVRAAGDEEPKWRLTAPLDTAADEWNLRQLISSLGELRAEDFVSTEEAQQIDTGFSEPQATVKLEMKDGESLTVTFGRTDTRQIGDPGTEREIVYIHTSRRDEILVAMADQLGHVQKTAFDLRGKSVVRFNRDEVTRVKVKRTEGLSFTIARRPDGWFVEKPAGVPARQGAVDDVLWNLEDLSAQEFVSEKADEQQLRGFGLAAPQATITIELRGSTEPIQVFIGDETDDGSFYATSGESKQVVKISEFLMGDLPDDIADLEATDDGAAVGEADDLTGPDA